MTIILAVHKHDETEIAAGTRISFGSEIIPGGKDSRFGDLDAKFLIANAKGIFHVGNNLSVRKFDKYYAIGSGSSYSLGALDQLYDRKPDAETIARRAVLTAIKFDRACGGEVDLRKV